MEYNFKDIESKWQKIWEDNKVFEAKNDYSRPKYYPLVEFPYPSGKGLHVGHPRPYTALDIVARKRRLEGYNVLYTIGWDAFGLPAENFAIKNKIHPAIVTKDNIKKFKSQLKSLGLSFDWSREIDTTSPQYYKWTQWIFLKLFEKDLAYKKEMNVNWCTSCKVVLANEEVVGGVCERCGGQVVRKEKQQWMLKITDYAQKLLDGLDKVRYPKKIKLSQQNWIGKSTGASVFFESSQGEKIEVYTTRPDTLFGVTHLVLAPEHELIKKWSNNINNIDEIKKYCQESAKKSDFERLELNKEKTGVKIEGIKAINPVNNKKIDIYISDYVLVGYGTGAIMAVPAHDQRDWEFAKKYNINILEVVSGGDVNKQAFSEDGIIINSEFLNGLSISQAKEKMIEWLENNKKGNAKTNFKLRDWVFSRQRYWGEPIPIIHCEKCGMVPVPEDQLPLELPDVDNYQPTDDGQSPLAMIKDWVNVKCPVCGADAKRETDTMPQWAGSSWYFLRYCDPDNNKELASREALNYWLPVDWYNGGMEHTTLHLLYSRFWYKFLYDIGVVPTDEPYSRRTSHGLILGFNGEKMSKSKGNVVNPDDIINQYGADTMRLYEMFIGDFEQSAPWNSDSIKGCKRFLDKVWGLQDLLDRSCESNKKDFSSKLEISFNKTIKKITEDIENLKFNTAIAALMALLNEINNIKTINQKELKTYLILLNPFAPHITEEIWSICNFEGYITDQKWPDFDESKCQDFVVQIAIQINGKIKARIDINKDLDKSEVIKIAKENINISEEIKNKIIKKEIYVPGKLVNIVV
ncbi:MAG: leucine--tRNA ligase [Oscillospiraceae bacterium]|nr:leucine--tRNA ligase [Oscillospiraceae bacterium]